jgi:endonuclease YncB( thermonuclease family)
MRPSFAAITFRTVITALLCALSGARDTMAECRGEDGGVSVVTSVTAGETLLLEDGRAVRLTGILGPKPGPSGPAADARARMESALSALVLGKKVSLQLDERKRDRYGRFLAQVMVVTDAEPVWVQAALIGEGLARVMSFRDTRLCARELLKLEEEARRARKGHWETGFFVVRAAETEDVLHRLEQSYEIVEGVVSTVAEIKGKTYINFGQNWRRDFTAFISAQDAALVAGGDAQPGSPSPLASLSGRRIRVRGWLKNFNGPSITVTHPEQIELLDNATALAR